MVYSKTLVDQYFSLKQEAPEYLLMMQVGAFMQVMEADARIAAAVCGLKLQMVGDVDAPVVLGGFPKSGLDLYVGRLARAGHSLAIALQDDTKQRRITERIRVEVIRK